MMDLKDIVESANNENASVVEDGIQADVAGFVDTGSYILNALLSGTIHGGIPDNRITALAGESSTGKTFFSLAIARQFIQDNPKGFILYFDAENAVTSEMFEERDIDPARVAVFPVATVEDFRQQVMAILDSYLAEDEDKRRPVMIVLDSLGMLSTIKEVTDVQNAKNVRDMTRAQLVKGTFRVLTIKLAEAGIPMVMTNHTYAVIGSMFPTKEMGGGGGLKYAASTIVFLTKRKDKDGKDVIGNIIHCATWKSRLTKEHQRVDVSLNFDTGLNRYYGLVELAVKHGIFKKVSTRIQLPDGTKVFEKRINNDPEKYFTDEILVAIDEAAGKEFRYGSTLTLQEAEAELEEEMDE